MKVLLTGASGFIGAQIDQQLTARGDDVVRVDALIPEAHPADAVPAEGVHRLDVRDVAEWSELLDGVDAVCHQSAMVGAGPNMRVARRLSTMRGLGPSGSRRSISSDSERAAISAGTVNSETTSTSSDPLRTSTVQARRCRGTSMTTQS